VTSFPKSTGQHHFTIKYNPQSNQYDCFAMLITSMAATGAASLQKLVLFGASSEYPPRPLGSATTTIPLGALVYGSGQYSVSASSQPIAAQPAWAVFGDAVRIGWSSDAAYNASGTYIGTRSVGQVAGEYIILESPEAFVLSTYILKSQVPGASQSPPSSWSLMGFDTTSGWTVLDSRTGISSWPDRTVRCIVTGNRAAYAKYALRLEGTVARTSGNGAVSLQAVKLLASPILHKGVVPRPVSLGTLVPVGVILPCFAAPSIGTLQTWLRCDGSQQPTITYPLLSSLIINIYGTADTGCFKLPNLIGRVPIGGLTPGITTGADMASLSKLPVHSHGTVTGTTHTHSFTVTEHTHTLTSAAHSHDIICDRSQNAYTHSDNRKSLESLTSGSATNMQIETSISAIKYSVASGTLTPTLSDVAVDAPSVQAAGADSNSIAQFSVKQPYITAHYIIKALP
jgi:microcystin-dependent protein